MNFDEPMDPQEFQRFLDIIDERMRTDPDAAEATRELRDWFMRRYPTLIDRCRYSTRKYRELSASTFGIKGGTQ